MGGLSQRYGELFRHLARKPSSFRDFVHADAPQSLALEFTEIIEADSVNPPTVIFATGTMENLKGIAEHLQLTHYRILNGTDVVEEKKIPMTPSGIFGPQIFSKPTEQ